MLKLNLDSFNIGSNQYSNSCQNIKGAVLIGIKVIRNHYTFVC